MSSIAGEKYVRLTTFTKDGRRKESPVWIADLGDGTVGFTTGTDSWKVKRIRATPRIELAPSTMRGVVADGVPPTTGAASVVDGADYERVRAVIKSKYGLSFTMMSVVGKIGTLFGKGEPSNAAVIMTLD